MEQQHPAVYTGNNNGISASFVIEEKEKEPRSDQNINQTGEAADSDAY